MRGRIGRLQCAALTLGCALAWLACAAPPTPVSRHTLETGTAATGAPPSPAAIANLERRNEDAYPGFFAWEKPPEDWWHSTREVRGPGIDVLLPYWMLRYYASHPGTHVGATAP
ncbi:MAG: hypothetical protein QF570_04280 [Myxococcota bacterium]|nr:hypothetical protein [Myxococcota bacterium]